MGQFSFIYSDTDRAMIDGKYHNSYLLVPTEFSGEFGSHHILEECYDGYGDMGGYDVYDLVAYWNKDFIYNNPDFTPRTHKCRIDTEKWYDVFCRACSYNDFSSFKQFFEQYGTELRDVGITIACYNNEELENPIKIVESDNLIYQQAYPSKNDPNQGWYDWGDNTEMIEQIIDIFEDYITDKFHIMKSEVVINGSDYDCLANKLDELLTNWS